MSCQRSTPDVQKLLVVGARDGEGGRTYPAVRVEEALVCARGEGLEERRDGLFLVGRPGELRGVRVILTSCPEQGEMVRTTSLNPPPEKNTAVSGTLTVPPTAVTLFTLAKARQQSSSRMRELHVTHKGHEGGNNGTKRVALRPSFVKHS